MLRPSLPRVKRRKPPRHSQVHQQRSRFRISIFQTRGGILTRRKPQQHEFPIPLHFFDVSSRKVLLHRRRIIDEIRFPQPYRQNPPPRNGPLQSPRNSLNLRELRHKPVTKIVGAPHRRPPSSQVLKNSTPPIARE